MGHLNKAGEPIVRNRAIVLKADGVVMVCPKCKSDVRPPADFAKALSARLLLFLDGTPAGAKIGKN
jgi:hypothetical protein